MERRFDPALMKLADMTDSLTLRVHSITYEASDVRSFELRDPSGAALPAFTAGAHLDLRLPGGIERSYSLIDPGASHRYRFAVQRAPESRGGSAYLFDQLDVGDLVEVVPPSNNFDLVEQAPLSVFIAGGIGITPLWAMIQRLEQCAGDWRLYYVCRTRSRAAFLDALLALEQSKPGRVFVRFDDGDTSAQLDIAATVASQPAGSHLYCCGPSGLLKAFEAATQALPPAQVHLEYFAAAQAPAAGGFEVVMARSGATVAIPADKTILETLLACGYGDLPRSCMSGVCGTCETAVLEGQPDHRDEVLSDSEKASNRKIMICCSGSLGPRLVLDL